MSGLDQTTKGMRVAIAFLGRRNAGKSSLINALVGFDLSIVSDVPGTTTDPVDKAVEINPLGPCLVIDTAGLDDVGELGKKRIERTKRVVKDADVGIIIVGDGRWTPYEEEILNELKAKEKPVVVALNKSDLYDYLEVEETLKDKGIDYVHTVATANQGIDELKERLRELKKIRKIEDPTIIGDLLKGGDMVVLVVPIDLGAPKGRLILPQVQTIRDVLDNDASALIVKERELSYTLSRLACPPRLVITDSQVVLKVAGDVPEEVDMTTFSIIFARFKGDLRQMVLGAKAIDSLQDGDKVLIAEACTHHALADDIGRVKIPRWIRQYTGRDVKFDVAAGPVFPSNVKDYKLIIQCGGCTITRTAYLNRIETAVAKGVPITNYGVAISYVQGVLKRTIRPFPEVRDLWEEL